MKKLALTILVVAMLLSVPLAAIGATLTGSIQGFMCVTQGKVCPIGKEDPMAAVENVFVLLVDAAKGDYYFLPNVDKAVLTRHINQTVRVEGKMDQKMKAMQATAIYVGNQKVWSADLEDSIYNDVLRDLNPHNTYGN